MLLTVDTLYVLTTQKKGMLDRLANRIRIAHI